MIYNQLYLLIANLFSLPIRFQASNNCFYSQKFLIYSSKRIILNLFEEMKIFALGFTILTAFLSNSAEFCKGRNQLDLMQSGIVEVTNSLKNQINCYQVPILYEIPKSGIRTALSISKMEGYNPTNGIDFSVKGRKKNNKNSLGIYTFFSLSSSWKSISLSYLVSSREDIYLGSFITDTFSINGCQGQPENKFVIQQIIPYTFLNNSKYNAAVYISGIRTFKQVINFRMSQYKFDSKSSKLSLKIDTDTNLIEVIYLNYILFQKGFFDVKTVKIGDSLQPDYSLIGTFQLFKTRIVTQQLGIYSDRVACIGLSCVNSCISKRQCYGQNVQLFDDRCLICQKSQKIQGDKCVSICGRNYIYDKGSCICPKGFTQLGKNCFEPCLINQVLNSQGKCECRTGLIKINGFCRQCPINSKLSNNSCVCNQNYVWDQKKSECTYKQPNYCPPRSTWNPSKLSCQCQVKGQYLINFKCDKCQNNEEWNGFQCVCSQNYYKVNGLCQTCDINSNFDGKVCNCNWGFYSVGNKCQKCHLTCGKCTGSGANNCLSCSEVSLVLKDGYCTKNPLCPMGFYLKDKSCQRCPSYCSSCVSETQCGSCIFGFNLLSTSFEDGTLVKYCQQICGDGRRFQSSCDDGNLRNGDGCSSKCQVEKGYSCTGGTTIAPSTCSKKQLPRSIVTLTASAQFIGKVVQGIKLNYLPVQLTSNQCKQCFKVLQVKVIKSPIVPSVQLNFIPKSQYQFFCTFDFYGMMAIPVFTISVQINPQFAHLFSPQDIQKIQIKQIDPALLARVDISQTHALSFDEIDNENTQIQRYILDHDN